MPKPFIHRHYININFIGVLLHKKAAKMRLFISIS